jgi:hypothetical protein
MSPSSPPSAGLAANERLVLDRLDLLEGTPIAEVGSLWGEFEASLLTHFDDEERSVLADLLVTRPRDARLILEEHRYLRGRLARLRADLASVSLAILHTALQTFIAELRAHGRHEQRVMGLGSGGCEVAPGQSTKAG